MTTYAAALPDEITAMAKAFYRQGWMPGTAGNISALAGADTALITGSGMPKGDLTERDLVRIRIHDSTVIVPNDARPSAETAIHMAVYHATNSGAVVHVHSPFATAVSVRCGCLDTTTTVLFHGYELLKGLGLIDSTRCALPVFPNWMDVQRISRDVEAHLTNRTDAPPVLLIAGHGATAWGRDLAQARDRLECLEALCELYMRTGQSQLWRLGQPSEPTTGE
jgi:methylthioribose-1-phosphate isomerase